MRTPFIGTGLAFALLLFACGQQTLSFAPSDGDLEFEQREGLAETDGDALREQEADSDSDFERDDANTWLDGDAEAGESEAEPEARENADGDLDQADGDSDAEREVEADNDAAEQDTDTERESEGEGTEPEESDGAMTDDGLEECIVLKIGTLREASVAGSGWRPDPLEDCYKVELDDDGRISKFFPDRNCSGSYSECFRYEYENDRLMARYYDESCDDALGGDERMCTRNTYDAQGVLVHVAESYTCTAAGMHCWDYTRDVKGRITRWVATDCNGKTLGCGTSDYDDAHNRITQISDSHLCDGTERTCCSYSYDAHGYRVSGGCDESCDSVMDTDCQDGRLNEQGWIVWETYDEDCTAPVDFCKTNEYDSAGHMRLQSFGCGEAQSDCYWQLYDASGHLRKVMDDHACDQKSNMITQDYTYDEAGRLTSCHISSTTNATTIDYSYAYGRCRPGALRTIDDGYEIATRNPCTWAGSW